MAGVISTAWLQDNLDNPSMRILDTRNGFDLYEEGHLPGAEFLHIETLRLSNGGIPCKMMPVPILAEIFGRLGIRRTTPVAIYASRPIDHVNATYTAWSLAVTGNPNVQILDGGYRQWEQEQRPITQQFPNIRETDYAAEMHMSLFADWRFVKEHLDNPDVVLVDSRTRGSYAGETGPTMRWGHIPGAILHNYLWDFQRQDGGYKPVNELRDDYLCQGITPDKEIVTYCVTGREGSAVWFALKYYLGYPRVRLYQASLTEWSARPDLPMVTGTSPYGLEAKRRAA